MNFTRNVKRKSLGGKLKRREEKGKKKRPTKRNSKLIKDPNIKLETIKFLEEGIDKTLSDINHSRIPVTHLPE